VGLVNLLTDLSQFRYYTSEGYTGDGNRPGMKSLKYGNDQLGGGNSGQPYIKASIPDGFNDLQLANNDFILRGGSLTSKDSATDVLRLGKMFKDTKSPNGLLFIAKQNLLSRTAVKTQTSGTPNGGVYTPLSTLAQAGLIAFGTHLNKQGLNPFAGTGAYSNNSNLYEVRMNNYNEEFFTTSFGYLKNRLIGLYTSKIDGVYSNLGSFSKTNSISPSPLNILSYDGGPGSILGVGKTDIRFASNLTVSNPSSPKYNKTIYFPNGSTLYTQKNLSGDQGAELNVTRNTSGFTPEIQDFRKLLREELLKNGPKDPTTNLPLTTTIPLAPDYKTQNIEDRVNIGGLKGTGPGNRQGKNLISYTAGSGIGPVDRINALPIYSSNNGVRKESPGTPVNDLVKFRIAVIDNSNPSTQTFIHFRAFIDNFSDSYNATWNPVTYLGRGENFYTYSNYTRTISMGWTVAAQSKDELIPMYKKLNYLASSLTPYYTPKGYMTGNLVQLTVGGYLYEQVGIINSITYDIPEESPWEIGINDTGGDDTSVKELSHIIRVTNFSFTPIQDFIPSLQSGENGSSRYISLSDGGNNNYDKNFKQYTDFNS
jgi:hypothetical protein